VKRGIFRRWYGALLLGALGLSASADTNWPSFRGRNACGISDGPPTRETWSVERSEGILWQRPVPGLGHSSPIIWGDRLWITTAVNENKTAPLKVGLYGEPESADDNDAQQWKVLCFGKSDGKLLWEKTAREGIPRQKRHPKATHANCTMATDGTNFVAFFGSEGLYCYDFDGDLKWAKDFGTLRASPVVYNDAYDLQGTNLEWGFASSPIIYRGRVYLQCDVLSNGFVTALNVANGKEVWKTRRSDTATWSTPNICEEGKHPELVVNGWNHMGGYDAETGAEIWRMSGGADCPVPTPMPWHGLIFLMSAHGPRSPIYAVRAEATGDVSLHGASANEQVAWSILRGAAYMQTPLLLGDNLYSCNINGVLSCFEAATGKQRYKERLGGGDDGFTASPVTCGGKIYFTSERGAVYVLAAGNDFKPLATNHMGDVCMATPAISDGVLYFRTQGRLTAVGNKL